MVYIRAEKGSQRIIREPVNMEEEPALPPV